MYSFLPRDYCHMLIMIKKSTKMVTNHAVHTPLTPNRKTIVVTTELNRQLKIAAANRGTTMRELVHTALSNAVK